MALSIKWTKQADKGLENVLKYLEAEWTVKKILQLANKIKSVLNQIITSP